VDAKLYLPIGLHQIDEPLSLHVHHVSDGGRSTREHGATGMKSSTSKGSFAERCIAARGRGAEGERVAIHGPRHVPGAAAGGARL
jgi:hypothetical protein